VGPVSQRVQQLEDQQQATLKEIKMAIEQSPRVRKVDTRRAVRAISAEGLCRPKFEVGDVLGSFRLSRGCGMVSRFPLYSFESPVIDGRFWESNRFFFGGACYLYGHALFVANAPLASRRYLENCEIICAGVQLVRSVSGPVILTGDFNASLTAFDDMKALLADGWVDAALFDAERRGTKPEPSCKRATRHTFCVVSPLLVPALSSCVVGFHEDLPTHAVLVTEFELPASNPRVYKWIAPRQLDQVAFDVAKLERMAEEVGEARWRNAVDRPWRKVCPVRLLRIGLNWLKRFCCLPLMGRSM